MEINSIGVKYLGGWGDGSEYNLAQAQAGQAASLEDIFKTIRKYSKKDREYLREKWRKLYLFYVHNLLEEEDQNAAMNDQYLRSIDKHLDLERSI